MSQIAYWHYRYNTRRGPVSLVPSRDGRYQVWYDNENLGSYADARMAADDVSGGHTFEPSNGADFFWLGVPEDLSEWECYPLQRLQRA